MLDILITDTKNEITQEVDLALNTRISNYRIKTISSGKDCLNTIKNTTDLDLVIIDMNASDIPCLNLVEKIREDSDIPIIVISRSNDILDLVRALDSGANDYIVRPFNKNIFAARLKAIMRRREWDLKARNK